MSTTITHEAAAAPAARTREAAKRSAALYSVLAAACITALKLVAGVLTGSLGMISESAHSGIDLIASTMTLVSVRLSDRPADDDHNYGHGKIESLSAFVETGIMLASCVWLVYEAVHRILAHHRLPIQTSPWKTFAPFAVLLLSMAVDFTRSRSLARTARLHASEALAAEAAHFATDLWASAAVILGLAASYAGQRLGHPSLELADPIAAIAVAAIILYVSWRLARQTIDALLDRTPAETRAELIHDIAVIPGVLSVDRIRTRRSGASTFADLTLGMSRNLTFQRSEQITMAATAAVQRHLPGADVVVHSVPTATLAESVHDRIRAVAARRNLAIHEISVQQYDRRLHAGGVHAGGLHIDQHLEVDETMSLAQAHALVTDLEAEIRSEIPSVSSILTHIESEPATIERPASAEPDRELDLRLRHAARAFPEILDIHDVLVTRRGHPARTPQAGASTGGPNPASELWDPAATIPDHIQVSCHATLPDVLPMSRVHAIITALEGAFKIDVPEVDRLLIHPEPATDNRR